MTDTFRIYKDSTKVTEGESPSIITGLESNVKVSRGTYSIARVQDGEESEKVPIDTFTTALPAPVNATGTLNEDGSISTSCDVVPEAQAYLVHYSDANESDPHAAKYMGYTETNSWTLSAQDVPALEENDKIYLFVQAFPEKGEGTNDIEKAAFLNENKLGSAWSEAIVLTKKSQTTFKLATRENYPSEKNTIPEIKAYLDSNNIEYSKNAKKDELLKLIK